MTATTLTLTEWESITHLLETRKMRTLVHDHGDYCDEDCEEGGLLQDAINSILADRIAAVPTVADVTIHLMKQHEAEKKADDLRDQPRATTPRATRAAPTSGRLHRVDVRLGALLAREVDAEPCPYCRAPHPTPCSTGCAGGSE
jgi:hypothetical protein